ncbi:MAG: GNAT family N-acetyltransferase [Lachnospiraceae bacterium]|nr:GNAT family N-acetyltransferase [Lachnospiraceae bacterium]
MVFELKDTSKAEKLFAGWQETLIWSCLQGVMGNIYVTSLEEPESAVAWLGDFCFFAGKPEKELLLHQPDWKENIFRIMTPRTKEWETLIEETFGEQAIRCTRYAIKKEPEIFDKEKLQSIVKGLPVEYEIRRMDRELFEYSKKTDWCMDWVSQYDSYEMYEKWGLGVLILKDGAVVAGASSYSSYQGGIEIEIDTKEEYRRKGLAYICGAKLILECLERGWYPSWDAQNRWSVALAEKLGYHFDHEYTVYELLD